MIILAIETSCDDTCAAILNIKDKKLKTLSNVVSSQVKIHAKWGGVFPSLARREHQKNLPIVLRKTLREARNPKIDLIAVTNGPGLEPCLWVGVNFAKDLAEKLKIPLVAINHIESHILANFLDTKYQILNTKYLFPAVCLVVSGGHTQLILMRDFGQYQILGETRDDAAGECFDKVARILGLGYPGGPVIATEAAKLKFEILNLKSKIKLPRPMMTQKNYDFSFSGLKTAVLYKTRDEKFKIKDKRYIQAMCAEVQQAIIDVLIHKTLKAAKDFRVKSVILGGGVAANEELRRQFKEMIKKEIPNSVFYIPHYKYCTDNAAMIAITAYYNCQKGKTVNQTDIEADANLRLE